ncbi:MAG: glycosyltransferase family 39 protein [Caldilineaceae bacterium]
MKHDSSVIRKELISVLEIAPVSTLSQHSINAIMVAIVAVALLLRIGSAFYQGNLVTDLPGIYDQISYHELARRLLDGYGFSFGHDHWPATRAGEPTAHWSYLYTVYLAGVYALFGTQPVIARLIQAVIAGLLHSWLAWRIGRQLFGQTIGLMVAALSAVYIYFFYYAGALVTETFYILGILWTFDVAFRLATVEPKVRDATGPLEPWRLWCELGVAIGVTVLLRQLFLLFVPFLFFWLWWYGPNRRAALIVRRQRFAPLKGWVMNGFTCTTLIIVLMIAPWTIRNYLVFDTFVPLNTNAGFAFFWGNHPIYGTHFVGILPADGPSYFDLIPKASLDLNEAKLDRDLLQRGIGFILDDPVRFLFLSLSRTVEYFKFWPSPESGFISNIARVGSFGLLLPFMLYGLLYSTIRLRRPQGWKQSAGIILFYLFIVVYTGIHLLTWTLIRYRLPVDAVLLFFAAIGLVQLGQQLTPKVLCHLHGFNFAGTKRIRYKQNEG